MYRKMYAYGGLFLAVSFILSQIGEFGSVLSLGVSVASGILGNYLYMNQVEKYAQQSKNMVEPIRTQFIAKNSGTNAGAMILSMVAYGILIGIMLIRGIRMIAQLIGME